MKFSTTVLLFTIASSSSASNVIRRRELKSSRSTSTSKKNSAANVSPLANILSPFANVPPLKGIAPGVDRPKVILAQDVDYPPYAQLGPLSEDSPLSGFGADFARALPEVCDLDVALVQTQWERCWDADRIGEGLATGEYHGCMTYTHTAGVRNRYLEFSKAILNDNKSAGILTRLEDGIPFINGLSNLSGLKVVDVPGFAPTEDNLAIITNLCTGESFSNYEIIKPTSDKGEQNDKALLTLLSGDADAMWVYSDQAENFKCENSDDNSPWDCSLWDGLGKTFAYIQTGSRGWTRHGTTLAISKLGSGLAEVLDPCIAALIETKTYYELCEKYDVVDQCFMNEFFPERKVDVVATYDIPTNELTTDCSSGYCSCPSPTN
jgi:hypothetical protein